MADIISKERVPYKIWDKVNSVWNKLNFLTTAKSVDADDGNNLEYKVGAINGITSDANAEASDIAASAKLAKSKLNNTGTQGYRNGQLVFYRDTGVNGNSYIDAPLILQTATAYNVNSTVRSGIGFHNAGNTAGMLYLDNDGHLKFIRNNGAIENITGLNGNYITYNTSDGNFYIYNAATGVQKKIA